MQTVGKKEKMLEVVKRYEVALRNNNDINKRYFAPEISEKVLNKLIKYYDNHLPVNSIVAYFDSTLFGSCKGGIIFTIDGIYHKFIERAVYFNYADIRKMNLINDNLEFYLNNIDMPCYQMFETLNKSTLIDILNELIVIDEAYGHNSLKESGKIKKIDLPKEIMDKCNAIIHTASVAAGGVGTGLAQIPASDNAVIVPIQIGMIIGLGTVFELHITESVAKSIIASAGATVAGRTLSQALVGWIPVIGNAINTATAAGVTEMIGWIAVNNFYERWLEDKNKGRLDGMKTGYSEASAEYERKIRKQAEDFLKQKKDFVKERDEYEKLLNEYKEYIEKLEKENQAKDKMREFIVLYEELKRLNIDSEED